MKKINFDYDIRATFDDIIGENMFFELNNNINDYDMLRLATELLRFEMARLDSDLDNEEIHAEYTKISIMVEQLETILDNYV